MTTPAPAERASAGPFALDARALKTIDLEGLNAAAGLLTRMDRKYLVPVSSAQALVDALASSAQVLQIGARQRFAYASTYLDTPDLEAYHLAARRRRRRFKVRARTYLDSATSFLEVKTRGLRGATVKERMPWSGPGGGPHVGALDGSARTFVAACLLGTLTDDPAGARLLADRLTPVLETTYERTTLYLPGVGARLTLDTGLTWRAPGPAPGSTAPRSAGQALAAGPWCVVETKSPGAAPGLADRLLWSAGHRPARVSKYATGLAALYPALPANRWHRVLGRELARRPLIPQP